MIFTAISFFTIDLITIFKMKTVERRRRDSNPCAGINRQTHFENYTAYYILENIVASDNF